VDESALTVLKGNIYPLATAKFDRGAAPDSLPMERMLLVLKRSPQQESALQALLDGQQDKSSPNYHKWLTPEAFGKQFGISDQDLQAVTGWLTTHGFQVTQVSKGRSVVEFRGIAAQVREAFHTSIHQYSVNGELHWANASDPQIPNALTPVVAGVWSLHNFEKKPDLVRSKETFHLVKHPGFPPEATNSSGQHALGPVDYATIYNIQPVYTAGNFGEGVTIAVVGRTDIDLQDVADFRSAFGISSGNTTIVNNGADPGNLGGNEEAEAVLDTTWSGAVAQNANVLLVVSATTDTTDGVDLSELYIVDNNLADIMTESFSGCEAGTTQADLAGISALAEQAVAQGITYTVSTGDTGSAGCDDLSETVATGPVSVNALASTAFNVAVGGTLFNENGHDSKYWNGQGLNTALSYIPENVWNESCSSAQCGSNANIAAGGGGKSTVVAKPNWQAGGKNIPADGFRDLPDVSLTAAGHDPYLLCFELSCSAQGVLYGVSGTSASTPAFAGIMALVDAQVTAQSGGTQTRVGQANYVLYKLAASENLSQCNASSTTTTIGSGCIFNDVTSGNNSVPGELNYGTPTAPYQSGVGYDLATGLGSVNVANLVNKWSSVTFNATTSTLSLSPQTNIPHGSAVAVNLAVKPSAATGQVSLIGVNGSSQQGITAFTLTGGNVAQNTNLLPGGAYSVHAHYAGDGTYAPSDSGPVSVTVIPESSTTSVGALTFSNSGGLIPFTSLPYGSFVYLRADVAGLSGFGFPTGQVNFSDNGAASVPGNPYALNSQGNTAPPNGLFSFTPGAHSITAAYGGDASFTPSSSAPTTFTIAQASTSSSLNVSPSSEVTPSTNVMLTTSITTTSGGNGPTGTVTFFNGTAALGTVPTTGTPASASTPASGSASMTIQLPMGQASLTAQYSGDTNYLASNASVVALTVSPDFQIPATLSTVNIASPGQSGTTTLAVTGGTGYNGTIAFSAASCTGLPFGANCSFTPASLTGSGSTTIMVSTTAPRTSQLHPIRFPWQANGGIILAGVLLFGGTLGKRRWASLAALLGLAALLSLVGCGGGGTHTTTPGTPTGAYPITVTATAGSITHTSTFTLNVQ
jgi:subtilase family serine protease